MKYLSNVKEITVTFRWLVILLLLLFIVAAPESVKIETIRWLMALFLVFIVSNTVLSFIRAESFIRLKLNFYVFLFDVLLISSTIYIIQGFDSDLFLIYFIIIFIATLSSSGLKRSLLIGFIAALLYFGFYLRTHPVASLLSPFMLLRIPFFFLLAFISTFQSEQLKGEVSRRQKAEEKSNQTLERYRTLVNTIPDIIYELDGPGRFVFLSEAVHQLGYSPRELLGKHFSQIIHPEDLSEVSREAVLPRQRGQAPADQPKLFDERRTGPRMTRHLHVRLMLKTPPPDGPAFIIAEVHSAGKWTDDPSGPSKVFSGSIGIIRDVTENTLDKLELLRKDVALKETQEELLSATSQGREPEVEIEAVPDPAKE